MEIVVYTKDNCIWCSRAKALLLSKTIPFKSVHMPTDISRDELLMLFPEARTMPIVTIDGVWIGGYDALEAKLKE